MGEVGLFAHERVELLDGTIVTMTPQSSPHAAVVNRLTRLLVPRLGHTLHGRVQSPIILDDWSEPEPDFVVCRADPHDYASGHPRARDIVLVCEVAISSLAFDRIAKAAAYAVSGIPTYWIVDVEVGSSSCSTTPTRRRAVTVMKDASRKTRRSRPPAAPGSPSRTSCWRTGESIVPAQGVTGRRAAHRLATVASCHRLNQQVTASRAGRAWPFWVPG